MRLTCLLLLFAVASTAPAQELTTIAFGSCSKEDSTQLWPEILSQKPQLWIWLGDNIYGDTHDASVLRRKYDRQKANTDYQKLIASCPVIGTWDDHDYGQNDGGRFYPRKEESKAEMMRFLDIPSDDPIRQHPGVYSAHTYGSGSRKIKLILLDTRTFRDTIYKSTAPGKPFTPNPDGDVLGEAQWAWLEGQLKNSDAAIHILGSSIQFISSEHGYEKWANFPKARERMLKLLTRLSPKMTFIISGDRHIAEISRMDVPGLSYPLYDFTSSGLTHTWAGARPETNSHRVGQMIVKKNYGLIRINWSGPRPVVTFEIRGRNEMAFDNPCVIR